MFDICSDILEVKAITCAMMIMMSQAELAGLDSVLRSMHSLGISMCRLRKDYSEHLDHITPCCTPVNYCGTVRINKHIKSSLMSV